MESARASQSEQLTNQEPSFDQTKLRVHSDILKKIIIQIFILKRDFFDRNNTLTE